MCKLIIWTWYAESTVRPTAGLSVYIDGLSFSTPPPPPIGGIKLIWFWIDREAYINWALLNTHWMCNWKQLMRPGGGGGVMDQGDDVGGGGECTLSEVWFIITKPPQTLTNTKTSLWWTHTKERSHNEVCSVILRLCAQFLQNKEINTYQTKSENIFSP